MTWFVLTEDHIRAATLTELVDSARAKASGALDPVTDAIESAVAEIRLAVAAGNPLDADETKIPLVFKKIAVRMVIRALSEMIGYPLTDDQQKEQRRDGEYLDQFFKRQIVLTNEDGEAPQNRGTWNSENKLIMRSHPVPAPTSQFPRLAGNYANPDAPEDRAP